MRRLAFLTFLLSGCGTVANLTTPPQPPTTCRGMRPSGCEPFGGVERSLVYGALLLSAEPLWAVPGAAFIAVDAPLSLAGDVVTLPVVWARQRGATWATWWGERAPPAPPPEAPRLA